MLPPTVCHPDKWAVIAYLLLVSLGCAFVSYDKPMVPISERRWGLGTGLLLLGAGTMIAAYIAASQNVSSKRIDGLVLCIGICFCGAAYCFGLLRTPRNMRIAVCTFAVLSGIVLGMMLFRIWVNRLQKSDFVPPDTVSLDLLYDSQSQAFNFTNHGPSNLYLWGDKLDDGPKSIDTPREITPMGSYHIFADAVIQELKSKVPPDKETRVPFEVYVSTEDQRKHIVNYQLWIRRPKGSFEIDTQNLGTIDRNF